MGIRNTREVKLVNQYRDYSENYVKNASLVKYGKIMGSILAKKAARINANSIKSVDTRYLYVYKKKSFGRICSCMDESTDSPSSDCPICYNTGFVGGYDKYGTWQEDIDYTKESDLINIEPAFETNSKPILLRLKENALKGAILVTIPIRANAGYMDGVDYIDSISDTKNSKITLYVKETGTETWFQFNCNSDLGYNNLNNMLKASSLDFKIVLERNSASITTPYFCDLKLRYGLVPKEDLLIGVDITRSNEGVSLMDYGFDESFGSITVNMDDHIQSLQNNDLFYYPDRNRWLSVTEVNPFQSCGVFISMEATARFLQLYEPQTKIMI